MEFEGRPGARAQFGAPARRFQQLPPMMQLRLQAMQARRNFAWQRFGAGWRGNFGAPPMPGPRRPAAGGPQFGGPGFGGPGFGGPRGAGRFGPPRNDGAQPPPPPPAPALDEPVRRRRIAV
jgi:hypothetical protein